MISHNSEVNTTLYQLYCTVLLYVYLLLLGSSNACITLGEILRAVGTCGIIVILQTGSSSILGTHWNASRARKVFGW